MKHGHSLSAPRTWMRARRPTEIDWITGAVVREAEKAGIAVPIHETLYRLVRARESAWVGREDGQKNGEGE